MPRHTYHVACASRVRLPRRAGIAVSAARLSARDGYASETGPAIVESSPAAAASANVSIAGAGVRARV